MSVLQLRGEPVALFAAISVGHGLPMVGIRGYDHVGIRVSDREAALAFYAKLGFAVDPAFSDERVAEVVARDGTRINLIFNGRSRMNNLLLDEPVKWPGFTHAAFVVERLEDVLAWAEREGVEITEGPVDWGRRVTCFLRDPDGNVLEFNELKRSRARRQLASGPELRE